MRVDIVTLFPELFVPFFSTSIVGRAVTGGALHPRLKSPRDFGLGRHRNVDDTPYGGGSGMVMRVDCIVHCLEALDAEAALIDAPTVDAEAALGDLPDAAAIAADPARLVEALASAEGAPPAPRAHRILLTPQGRPFDQRKAGELVAHPRIALICGRYEGFDDRVRGFVDEELSLGDFVLTGGEVAAMAIVDACARLLPGVLGNADSSFHESHSPEMEGLLEYPQYTRPVEFRGERVPELLQNGNHAAIEAFRRAESERRTRERRPDLWAAALAARADRAPKRSKP
jgi:tRNA (guanine37-N1)-methyltransferase